MGETNWLGPLLVYNWLRAKRMEAQELAAQLEVSSSTLSRWINGKLVPSKLARIALAKVIGRDELIDRWEDTSWK